METNEIYVVSSLFQIFMFVATFEAENKKFVCGGDDNLFAGHVSPILAASARISCFPCEV